MTRIRTAVRLASTGVLACAVAAVAPPAATAATSGTATATAGFGPANHKVIVLLRDQHADLPATPADAHRRTAVVSADQAPLRQRISGLGGHTTHAYSTLNAVAASVPAGALAGLRADPAVAEVVPDLVWHLPKPTSETPSRSAVKAAAVDNSTVCPSDPAKPMLEPEALEQTHTDSDDPSAPTARSLGYTGAGVKVGFIAEGIDVDQPDFIRADGSHVFTDYKDFSGDGTDGATSGGEAFGDASSIAAQGRESYDISQFVSTAHPLPSGCTIRVEGMAPGASMVAMKVFSNALLTAPTSTIIQAIDWAVNVDHVDVLNESFGSNPYPDTAADPISLLNRDAVDAGVTVVASAGDAGSGNSMGTGATAPWVINAGATTSERIYAQTGNYGFQLGNGHWSDGQISSLSSGGISQLRRVSDLVAPGDLNWALCSDRKLASGDPQYTSCSDNNGNPTNLLVFGGTSESAPLTAGAAALVIQAYRRTHGGTSPTPGQVRAALDNSADDLGLPAQLQGAGLLDSYRAVQLAASLGGAPKVGGNLTLSKTQVSDTKAPGVPAVNTVTVTNEGAGTQRVAAALRSVDTVTRRTEKTVQLSATSPVHTFVDGFGFTRSYVETTFRVAPGTQRLASTIAWDGPAGPIARLALLDPQGTYSGYSLPQGTGNFGRIELARPAAGTWTAIVFTIAAANGYTGAVHLAETSYAASAAGTVSPSSFVLAAGASRTITVTSRAPAAGSAAYSLVLTGRFGQTTTGSVTVETVRPLTSAKRDVVLGEFSTANGRSFGPGQADTYFYDVPPGAAALNIGVTLAGTPNEVVAHLADPSGEPVSTVVNQHPDGDSTVTDPGLQIIHANPVAGRWELTLEAAVPVVDIPQKYRLVASLEAARVRTGQVPTSAQTVISKSTGATQYVTVHNSGAAPQTYFVDARTATEQTVPLVAAQAADASDPYTAAIDLPIQTETVPAWLTPTESSTITVGAAATAPITFDLMPLDSPTAINAPNNPDTESSSGVGASVSHSASPLASVLWAAFPTLIGPAPAAGQSGENTTMQATVTTKGFYRGYTSSTGDPLLGTVEAKAPAATPVTVPAGGTATITLHLAPSGAPGSVESGTLFVDSLQPGGAAGLAGYADEVAAQPFTFTVGA